jgi:DNA-binding NarL/FixJ family response regulator
MSHINVLLVEDHRSFREALAFLLEREPDMHVVAEAATLADARSQLSGVDVAVLDLKLGDGDGTELIAPLRHASPDAAVLVLSGRADAWRLAETLAAGAATAMSKTVALSDIIAAVRRLGNGELPVRKEELARLLRTHNGDGNGTVPRLTPREREVLQGLADGLSGRQVARRLGISQATERTHMENARAKLGARSKTQALACAVRQHLVTIR